MSLGDIMIDVFETLRLNYKRIEGKIRELIHSLRAPNFFIKANDLFSFLSGLPIKWGNLGSLVVFCRAFDVANVSYFKSSFFMKSYSAYVLMEGQLKNKFNSLIMALRDILHANRVTPSEFERILTNVSEFGFCRIEKLI